MTGGSEMSMINRVQGWLYRYGIFGGLAALLVVAAGMWLPWWVVTSGEEGNFQIFENDGVVVTLRWGALVRFSGDLEAAETALREKGGFAPAADYLFGHQTFKKKAQIRILSREERIKDYRQRAYAFEVIEADGNERFTRFFVDAEEAVAYILQDRNWRHPERDIQRVPYPYPPYHQWIPKPLGTET